MSWFLPCRQSKLFSTHLDIHGKMWNKLKEMWRPYSWMIITWTSSVYDISRFAICFLIKSACSTPSKSEVSPSFGIAFLTKFKARRTADINEVRDDWSKESSALLVLFKRSFIAEFAAVILSKKASADTNSYQVKSIYHMNIIGSISHICLWYY